MTQATGEQLETTEKVNKSKCNAKNPLVGSQGDVKKLNPVFRANIYK